MCTVLDTGTYNNKNTYKQIKMHFKKPSRFYYNTISVNTNVIYHEVDFFSSKTITAYISFSLGILPSLTISLILDSSVSFVGTLLYMLFSPLSVIHSQSCHFISSIKFIYFFPKRCAIRKHSLLFFAFEIFNLFLLQQRTA